MCFYDVGKHHEESMRSITRVYGTTKLKTKYNHRYNKLQKQHSIYWMDFQLLLLFPVLFPVLGPCIILTSITWLNTFFSVSFGSTVQLRNSLSYLYSVWIKLIIIWELVEILTWSFELDPNSRRRLTLNILLLWNAPGWRCCHLWHLARCSSHQAQLNKDH